MAHVGRAEESWKIKSELSKLGFPLPFNQANFTGLPSSQPTGHQKPPTLGTCAPMAVLALDLYSSMMELLLLLNTSLDDDAMFDSFTPPASTFPYQAFSRLRTANASLLSIHSTQLGAVACSWVNFGRRSSLLGIDEVLDLLNTRDITHVAVRALKSSHVKCQWIYLLRLIPRIGCAFCIRFPEKLLCQCQWKYYCFH